MPKKRSPRQRRKSQQRSRVRRRRQADAQSYQSALQRIATDRQVPPSEALAGLVASRQDDFHDDPDEDDEGELDDWDDDETPDWLGEELVEGLIRYQQFSAVHRILGDTLEAVACLREARPARNLRATLSRRREEVGNPELAATVACILAVFELSGLAVRSGYECTKAAAEAAIHWLDTQIDARAASTAAELALWFGTEAATGCPPEGHAAAEQLSSAVLLLAAVVAIAPHDDLGRPDLRGFGAPPTGPPAH
jgi:hypothetical protein